jgi:ubiquinone/menaquinone biosynthesis C-methylase UbiE
MSSEQAAAYERSASAWAAGPDRVYAALAHALVAAAGVPVAGRRVLDVGAGTGAVSRAARDAGAGPVVACDLAAAMLRSLGPAFAAVQTDATRLPFRDGAFDLVLSGMTLGHFPDPASALREIRRVSGALAASAFTAGWSHPAKTVVDAALRDVGYRVPDWYREFKDALEPRVATRDRLTALAAAAGYADITVHRLDVDTGIDEPGAMARWRLGMAHTAPFVATLGEPSRIEVEARATAALTGAPRLVIPILVLAAR